MTIQLESWYHLDYLTGSPNRYLDIVQKEEIAISTINFRVNELIRSPQVRLIGADGENVGVVDTYVAMRMAREADRDLVEVAPNADPPVCRIMDFGKFLFEREKKEREAKKSQTKIEIKEIRLRPKTNVHHRGFKTQDARKWLQDGMKVRVSIKFRGREITYPELALEDLKEIAEELADVGIIEQAPLLEGKMMGMTLAPAKFAKKKVEAAPTTPVATPVATPVPAPTVPAVPVTPAKTPAVKKPAPKTPAVEVESAEVKPEKE